MCFLIRYVKCKLATFLPITSARHRVTPNLVRRLPNLLIRAGLLAGKTKYHRCAIKGHPNVASEHRRDFVRPCQKIIDMHFKRSLTTNSWYMGCGFVDALQNFSFVFECPDCLIYFIRNRRCFRFCRTTICCWGFLLTTWGHIRQWVSWLSLRIPYESSYATVLWIEVHLFHQNLHCYPSILPWKRGSEW